MAQQPGDADYTVMDAAMDRPVARLQEVSHVYGSTVAVNAVTLEIASGRMIGLIGPDGTGKSTLLGLVAGARKIQNGRVEVLNGDMADAKHRNLVCPRIAYMPQGLGKNLYPTLSVLENVDFFGRLFGHSKQELDVRIDELLESTDLGPFSRAPCRKALWRDEAEAGVVLLADSRSRSADSR